MTAPLLQTLGTGRASTDGAYGLLRLAGLDVALPLTALREVVPCPEQLAGLPVSAPGLLGAIDLRSLVLPVVDLRPVLDRDGDSPTSQVVVVTAHDGQSLGLLADQVLGVIRVPESALQRVRVAHGDGRRALFSHTFRSPADGSTVSVLDAEAILALPGVPTVQDASIAPTSGTADRAATGGGQAARPTRTYTTVECGPYRLAIDADSVHTLLPSSATTVSVLDSALCRGVTEFSGREVPVVDPLVLLGFAPLPEGDTGAGLVLDLEHGYVVLALTGLLSLDELADEDVLPVADFVVSRPELLAGMVASPGHGTCLVLDQHALRTAPELLGLSAVNTTIGGDADAARGAGTLQRAAADGGQPYLTYSVGQLATSPLGQVAEILPLPAASDLVPVGDHVLGVVLHRRAVVPLLCLATLLGRVPAPVTAASCWLLVQVDGQPFGFAVDALHEIDPLTWADADHEAGRDTDLSAVLRHSRLVQVGSCQDLLPEVDLHGLARAVRGGTGVLAPSGWSG